MITQHHPFRSESLLCPSPAIGMSVFPPLPSIKYGSVLPGLSTEGGREIYAGLLQTLGHLDVIPRPVRICGGNIRS
jgi:hypothetical protein